MASTATVAEIAALVGDPARANMLAALMNGRALTAAELARVGGVTPQTASGHLMRMTQAGLLAVQQSGRRRYHRLASPSVAVMLESIMAVASAEARDSAHAARRFTVGPRDKALRLARKCYDHLAGRVAVAIADRMVERGFLELSGDGGAVTDEGIGFLRAQFGADADPLAPSARRRSGRIFCRPCLDWSERRFHIAGAVGAVICIACFRRDWMRQTEGERAIVITRGGQLAMRKTFEIDVES